MLKIPTSALFRDGDAWAVFAVRGGRAARTTVRIGQRSALDAEILSGLEQGDGVARAPRRYRCATAWRWFDVSSQD